MESKVHHDLPAGREMDALVYQALHNLQIDLTSCRYVDGDVMPPAGYPVGHVSPPHYSTDILCAYEVRDKIKSNPDTICVDIWNENEKEYCNIHTKTGVYFSGECKTSPLAICRAALLSVVGEQ